MENDSFENRFIERYWWISLIALAALISGLWCCLKSCRQDDYTIKRNHVESIMDTISKKSENETQLVKGKIDSITQLFKSKWQALGNIVTVKLGEINLTVPEKGLERNLIEWLQNKTTKVDKSHWFHFDRILFESGSLKLNKVSDEQLNNIALIMKFLPKVEFKIGGYTDNAGEESNNIQLSKERADAVKQALVDLGINSNRLTTEGFGSAYPVADNSTEMGREQNRRVGIRVTKK